MSNPSGQNLSALMSPVEVYQNSSNVNRTVTFPLDVNGQPLLLGDGSGLTGIVVDPANLHSLTDSGGALVVDGLTYRILNTSGNGVIDWLSCFLNDSVANTSVDWNSRYLISSSGFNVVLWDNGILQPVSNETDGGWVVVNSQVVPTSVGDPGRPGQLACDDDFLYVCCATAGWKRIALVAL